MKKDLTFLGIETSCDETAASIVREDAEGNVKILSNVVSSQVDEHLKFGGVVPENAARSHAEKIDIIIKKAIDDSKCKFEELDGIAATAGPGLLVCLMVGLSAGKSIAGILKKPFLAINHLEGHALTPRIFDKIEFPYLLLLVSGGHTQFLIVEGIGKYKRIGTTIDDALGETFDKTAKMIGLDRIVEGQTDITGKVTAYGRDVAGVRKEFNDLIKAKNEDYRIANAKFADSERIQDAFVLGQKYQRLDPKEAMDKLKGMNNAEKESFRLGMMADVNERLANFKGGDFTRQIFKSPKQKSLLRYAFEDEGKFNEFSKVVSALEEQSKTAKNIIRGSPTGERLATGESAAELGQLAQTYATRGMTGVAMDLARQGLARTRGISGETSAELQRRLFAVDPVEQRAILDELKKRTQSIRPIGNVPAAAGLGTVTGLLGQ